MVRSKDLYPRIPHQTIKIDTTVSSLVDFAQNLNINYRLLKILNPWLRSDKLSNESRKLYEIKIPKGKIEDYDWLLKADENSSDTIHN